MLITHIRLENFKSYAQATVTFQPGTNAITGVNGAGKSTLLEAIGFALFDHHHQAAGLSLGGFLREGEAWGRVIVGLISSLDERQYEVERVFSSKATTRYRVHDVELEQCLAEGGAEVLPWLRAHLKVSPMAALDALFESTIGVPQGTFTAPFLMARNQRKGFFDPLLQVDEYRKASDALRDTVKRLGDQRAELERAIARLEGQLAELPRLLAEREALRAEETALAARVSVLEKELAQAQEELQGLERAGALAREAAERGQQAEIELGAEERLLESAARSWHEAEEAARQVEAARAGYEAYGQAEEKLAALEEARQERDQLLQRRAEAEKELARSGARREQLARELDEIAAAEAQMATLAPRVAEQERLEQERAEAERLTQQLYQGRRRAQEAAEEAQAAKREVGAARQGLTEAEELEHTLAEAEQRREGLAQQGRQAGEGRAAVVAEMERLRKQATTLVETQDPRCPVCEAELTPAHREELLGHNAARVQELASEARRLQAQVKEAAREQEGLAAEIEQMRRRLRTLPTPETLCQAEERAARRREGLAQAQAEVLALEGAPARAAYAAQELTALGDPRREYRLGEDKARVRSAREQEHAALEAARRVQTDDLERLERQLATFAGLTSDLAAAQEARRANQAAHHTYLSCVKLAQQSAERQERAEQLAAEVAQKRTRLEALRREAQAAQAAYDATRHERLRAQASQAERELAGAHTRLKDRRDRAQVVAEAIARAESLEGELAEKRGAGQEAAGLQTLVERFRDLLKQAGPHVTQRRVRRISWDASMLYADIMDDHTATLQWTEDYELLLEAKGRKRTFHQLSGGEQMSAALALRLALLRETSAIDVAFFDEPTAHLDAERRQGLAEKIMQVKGFQQMFVISHDDTFERAAQNYIRIHKDEEGSHIGGAPHASRGEEDDA